MDLWGSDSTSLWTDTDTHFPPPPPPASLTGIKLSLVSGVSHALFFHFMPLLMRFPLSPSPSPHLQESRRACKGALIERNINLQVTNSSRSRAGAGVYVVNCCVVKPGPPRLLCPLRFPLALPADPTTSQPEPPHMRTTRASLWLQSNQLQELNSESF